MLDSIHFCFDIPNSEKEESVESINPLLPSIMLQLSTT